RFARAGRRIVLYSCSGLISRFCVAVEIAKCKRRERNGHIHLPPADLLSLGRDTFRLIRVADTNYAKGALVKEDQIVGRTLQKTMGGVPTRGRSRVENVLNPGPSPITELLDIRF